MAHFDYPRHFGLLAAATAILFLLGHWSLLSDSLITNFAINGAAHALALALTLRVHHNLTRKVLFILIAIALSILTMYVGIICLVLFAVLPATERLYVVLGVCSLSGALTYGSLIRIFWMRMFAPRIVLVMAVFCMLATSAAFFARAYSDFFGSWWLTAVWWLTLSGSLWYFDTHRDGLQLAVRSPGKDTPP